MSSNFVIPRKLRHVLVSIYDHDSLGPRYHDIPDLELQLRICQTTPLRSIAASIAAGSSRQDRWTVGKILDRHGDEFVDPAETVWGALGLMPICIIKAAPTAEVEDIKPYVTLPSTVAKKMSASDSKKAPVEVGLSQAEDRHDLSSAPTPTLWNAQDDKVLLHARQAGGTFPQIQARRFLSRTAGSCQLRYRRLMSDKEPDGLAHTRDVELKSEIPLIQASHPTDGMSKQGPSSSTDSSDEEPRLLSLPKATDPNDGERIAATHSILNTKARDWHHKRKPRREAVESEQKLLSSQGLLKRVKLEHDEENHARGQQSELDYQTAIQRSKPRSSRSRVVAPYPDDIGSEALASTVPPPQGIATETPRPRPSSSPDQKATLRRAHRKPMSLTLIKVRGKRHDRSQKEVVPSASPERELSQQEEREYEATIDANLRRAREEAERQTSATRLERAERFRRSLLPRAVDYDGERSPSPDEPDSSPTARVAKSRDMRAQRSAAHKRGAADTYQSSSETTSSPPALGGADAAQRRVRFDGVADGAEAQFREAESGLFELSPDTTNDEARTSGTPEKQKPGVTRLEPS